MTDMERLTKELKDALAAEPFSPELRGRVMQGMTDERAGKILDRVHIEQEIARSLRVEEEVDI